MLPGLSPLELGRLRMSVGYGQHKKGRLLSPIEVGALLRRACDAGSSLDECAKEIRIDATGLKRFLRILDLPDDLRHVVSWGSPRDGVGFSSATELARIPGVDDQRAVAGAILANGLHSKEVRQVAQLRERSGRPVEECVKEVINMRTTIDRRYVFIGAIVDQSVQQALANLPQRERDTVLAAGVESIGLKGASGRLGPKFFTLVGDESFGASMEHVGKQDIEARLRAYVAESVESA